MKHRLFLGIPVPQPLSVELYNLCRSFDTSIRIVPQENYHVTISFFGEIEEKQIPSLHELLKTILVKVKPFSLKFEKIDVAPPGKKPTMTWVYMQHSEAFTNAVKKIERQVENRNEANDFRKNNKPIPHITLARSKKGGNTEILHTKYKLLNTTIEVSSCYLFESHLTPNGPVYMKLKNYNLTKP